MQNLIKDMLGVTVIQYYEKYLGLPSLVGKNKKESFTHIKQQIWKKLQGWEAKLLSQAGREVLIKAVAQLPTNTMSCFKLPITLCHEIKALICRFFWGQGGDCRKIHWVKWQDLCKPKTKGGMGLKISPCTMTYCWQNKLGGCYMTLNPFFRECSKPSSSQIPQFWKQNVHQVHPMLGRA